MIRACLIVALVGLPLSGCFAAESQKTFSADDVRAAFRLGLMQGAKEEHDRGAQAALDEMAKGAQNILPALQVPPPKP